MKSNNSSLVIITGPTGVGKTDFSLQLAERLNGEIINGDMGQFYVPLSIGTAKPDWRSEKIPHHLFDSIDQPVNFTVVAYRKRIEKVVAELRQRGKMPIIVGGSLFYLKSLFFPPTLHYGVASPLLRLSTPSTFTKVEDLSASWDELKQLDPKRAAQIDPHDSYRINRALALAREGLKPSLLKPLYMPVVENMLIIHLTRNRDELYERINARTDSMLTEGWLDEVSGLDDAWKSWLKSKKMIGYDTIIDCLAGAIDLVQCRTTIQQRTRNYAKRQLTFWRSFREQLEAAAPGTTHEINLTLSPVALYLERLLKNVITPL